jgi:hypothetical protein
MKQILICAEGGCCGNFVASLIRTMQNPSIYVTNKHLSISSIGSCDHMSCGSSIVTDYMVGVLNIYPYPESKANSNIIYNALAHPETTYFKVLSDWEKQNDTVNVIHYWWPENIKKFLSIENVNVIMIRSHEKDYRLVAINKINKNFDASNDRDISSYKLNYKNFLKKLGHDTTELDNLTSLSNLSTSFKELLYKVWEDNIRKRSKDYPVPDHCDKLDILYVDDIYNDREKVISLISRVMKLEANDNTYKLYDDYMIAQKDILDYIEKTNNENINSRQQ